MSRIPPDIQLRNAKLAPHLMYICPECGKAFRSQPDWRTHLNQKHDYESKTINDFDFKKISDRFHECQICFKWVASEKHTLALIQYHRFMHLPFPQTYRCLHCRTSFSRRRALNDHLEEQHKREIRQYEARMTATTLKKIQQGKTRQQRSPPSKKPSNKDDLIRKALQKSQIDLEAEAGTPNPTEVALDRSLSALEELLRLDTEPPKADSAPVQHSDAKRLALTNKSEKVDHPIRNINNSLDDEAMEQLCEKLFEDDDTSEIAPAPLTDNIKEECDSNQETEVITIEIDALGEEEVKRLRQEPKLTQKDHTPSVCDSPTSVKTDKLINEQYDRQLHKEFIKHITYLCPECADEFNTEKDWRKHVFSEHDFANITATKFRMRNDKRTSKCLECFEVLRTTKKSELVRHYFQHLPYRSYLKCEICNRTKSNTAKILNHIKYNHAAELRAEIDSQTDKNEHREAEEQDNANFKCQYCDKTFKMPERLERHMKPCKVKADEKQRAQHLEEGYKLILEHLNEAKARMRMIRSEAVVCHM